MDNKEELIEQIDFTMSFPMEFKALVTKVDGSKRDFLDTADEFHLAIENGALFEISA